MGMAYRAPTATATYKAKYFITSFVVDKYREYAEPESRDRGDHDLARLIDERITVALQNGRMQEVVDADAPQVATKVALIESRNGRKCYVVMRPWQHRGANLRVVVGPEVERGALVTLAVVSETFGGQRIMNGSWKMQTGFNPQLARKLAAAVPALPATAPAPAAEKESEDPKPTVDPERGRPPGTDPKPDRAPRRASLPRPAGTMSREATERRTQYARELLKQRPFMPMGGPDGLLTILRNTFGVGLSPDTINDLRKEAQGYTFEAPRQGGYHPTGNVQVHSMPPVPPVPTKPFSALADVRAPAPQPVLAVRLAAADEREKAARAALDKLVPQVAAAETELAAAQREVDTLMAEFQASRGRS